MTDKEKIRAEILRLKDDVGIGLSAYDMGTENGAFETCEKILQFIDSIPEEPVSEDLEEAAGDCFYHNHAYATESFIEGANWQNEQFEKNRLSACDAQTEEEAQREMDFVMSILKNEHRQPTFSDAIEYGMRVQKQQMIDKACACLKEQAKGVKMRTTDRVFLVSELRKAMEE